MHPRPGSGQGASPPHLEPLEVLAGILVRPTKSNGATSAAGSIINPVANFVGPLPRGGPACPAWPGRCIRGSSAYRPRVGDAPIPVVPGGRYYTSAGTALPVCRHTSICSHLHQGRCGIDLELVQSAAPHLPRRAGTRSWGRCSIEQSSAAVIQMPVMPVMLPCASETRKSRFWRIFTNGRRGAR